MLQTKRKRMIRIHLIFFLLLTLPLSLFAQDYSAGYEGAPREKEIRDMVETESEQRLVVQCAVFMQEGYSYYAEIIADKLIELKPESANYNFRKGSLLLQAHTDQTRAIPYLRKSIGELSDNADMYSAKATAAPTDAYYYLGYAFHLEAELDSAEFYYQKFLDNAPPETDLVALTRLRLKQTRVARREINNPRSAIVENIGPVINTQFPEFSPVSSLDGSALYFTSRRPWEENETEPFRDPFHNHYPEDIYVSYVDFDGSWMDPFKLDFNVGRRNEATTSVSADERRIYVYQDDSVANGDIFYSDFETNRFQDIKDLNDSRINTPYWEPHAMVSSDGKTLFFSSDRPGGYGARDIYRVVKLPDGSWSDPINLGPTINTPYDEDAPFMAIDNKTLYFSSNGPLSMGDFDVFVARLDDEGNWSNPINLGYPINSTGDDIYYTTTVDGLRGFITSHRKDGYGDKDIYEIKNDYLGLNAIAVLKGLIKTVGNKPIPPDVAVDIACLDCIDNSTNTVYPRLRDGAYFSSLEPCHEYELVYTYDNRTKEVYRETVKTSCSENYDEIYRDILIDIAEDGRVTRLETKSIVSGTVTMEDNSAIPTDEKVTLTCLDCQAREPIELFPNENAGAFETEVKPCHTYVLVATHNSDQVEDYRDTLKSTCNPEDGPVVRHIVLPVEKIETREPNLIGTVKTSDGSDLPDDVVVELTCLDCEEPEKQETVQLSPDREKGGAIGYPLEACHEYEIICLYDNRSVEVYKEKFKTGCTDNEPDVYKDILITPAGKPVKTDLKGTVKTVNGDPLPKDMVLKLACIDCSDTNEIYLEMKGRNAKFEHLLQACHEYRLRALYNKETVEVYREFFKSGCSDKDETIYRDILIDLPIKEQVIDEVDAIDFENPKFKHYFEYNRNKINPKRGSFKEFVGIIEEQLAKGRKNFAINVYSSASYVPTRKYKTNENLTKLRAENIKYDLITYFQENTNYSDRIVITVVDAKVDGPEYKGDWRNRKKYRNFQFVEVLTE